MLVSPEEHDELIEAANALSLTTALLEKRIAGFDGDMRAIRAERKAAIDKLVALLLPDLRPATYQRLLGAVPRFVDSEVHYLLNRRWYVLHFFKREGYDLTLTTLRTRMAYAAEKGLLPQIAGQIEDWNSQLDKLQAERGQLTVRQRDVLVSLDLLRAAVANTVRLPAQAMKDVHFIVQRARAANSHAQARRSAGQHGSHAVYESKGAPVVYVDDVDVWTDFAADVPQSLSVMAFEAIRQTHQANPMSDGSGVAPGSVPGSDIDFADPPARVPGGDIDFGNDPASRGGDIDFGDEPGSADRAVLATDDSLGAYS